MTQILLLGPQMNRPTLDTALQYLGVEGPVCLVSAGWQEREDEIQALEEHLRQPVVNLELYQRANQLFEQDPDFFSAYRARQDRLKDLQKIYRIRLACAYEAVIRVRALEVDRQLVVSQARAALESIRQLDAEHLRNVREIHAKFDKDWQPAKRRSMAGLRRKLKAMLKDSSALLIAGGNVTTLLNRVRLFELLSLAGDQPVVAWSGGTMILAERLVVFHDSPPQGAGNAEVMENGLGACPGILPLPRARERLKLEDPARVSLFATRFAPLLCLTFDEGAMLHWNGVDWISETGTRLLFENGEVKERVS